jgi:maleylpyruvate isomerase
MSRDAIDTVTLAADIADVAASQLALVDHLRSLDPIHPATPSRLPNWTVGHVLAHIARNADSQLSMLAGRPQYPHGVEGRNADIEAGSVRTWDELVADVEQTAAAVDDAFRRRDDWSGEASTVTSARPLTMLPFLRQREVEVHRTDLGLGYEFDDLPARYVRQELRFMEMMWRARKPMGLTPLPAAALALSPARRLAWLMGRTAVDGLPPADLF